MKTEQYRDMLLHCEKLLAQAHTVDSEKNKEAVREAAKMLSFSGLEMKRLDVSGKLMIQKICFMKQEREPQAEAKEYRFEEENGIFFRVL